MFSKVDVINYFKKLVQAQLDKGVELKKDENEDYLYYRKCLNCREFKVPFMKMKKNCLSCGMTEMEWKRQQKE